ncbi:MAG: hypothetical protein FWF14_05915 [Streptococcaceae bacterium]|nr:hypothetical protein [Streptococcaceae bacterium]
MSLFPFITSWVGREPMKILPEITYLLVGILSVGSFHLMDRELRRLHSKLEREDLTHTFPAGMLFSIFGISFALVWFYAPIVLIVVLILVIFSYVILLRSANGKSRS